AKAAARATRWRESDDRELLPTLALCLAPVEGPAAVVGRVESLAYHSLEPLGAGTIEQRCGIAWKRPAGTHGAAHSVQDLEQPLASLLEWCFANRPGTHCEQVEHHVVHSTAHRAIESLLQLLEVARCGSRSDDLAIEDQVVPDLLAARGDSR